MKILSDEVKKILRANYVTGNHGCDEDPVCETEEEFTNRIVQEICQQVRELLDGIENPLLWSRARDFDRAIQTIKALLEE